MTILKDKKSSVSMTLGDFPFSLSADELRHRADDTIKQVQQKLDDILVFEGPKTIENFLEPLNRLMLTIFDMATHGQLMFNVHPDEPTRTAGREVSEAANCFINAFRVNEKAYKALQSLDLKNADEPTRYSVKKMLRDMRRAGVELDTPGRERILALSNEIDRTSNQFEETIAKSEPFIEVSPEELAGLPADFMKAHKPGPNGKIRITTKPPDRFPVMSYCENAGTRRCLMHELYNSAYPENIPNLEHLLSTRYEFSRSLDYKDYAAYITEDKMVLDPETVRNFLDRIHTLLKQTTEQELQRILKRKRRDDPNAEKVEMWDVVYYVEKLRQEEIGVDSKLLRDYLPYGQVRDGLFKLCHQLFGLTIKKNTDAEVWHPTVEVYDVTIGEALIGRFFLDLVPREGKYNHAMCSDVRVGLQGIQLPQGVLVCNFITPDVPRETVRMQFDDVVTFFHEFGHLLHAILSGHVRWLNNEMASIEWDFVEVPSQLFEEWAHDPDTLERFAMNPDTGERAPHSLLTKLKDSDKVGRATGLLRMAGHSLASLEFYDRNPKGIQTSTVMNETFSRYYPIPMQPDDHFEAGWGHLTGYSAIYYSYLWALVIARDCLSPFREKGTLADPGTAKRYMEEILTKGSTRPASELIRAYLGRDFGFDAFEKWARGE